MAGCHWKYPLCWLMTHKHFVGSQGLVRQIRPPQPLHQDPRNHGRSPCHRGGDFRGDTDQRDAAVFARALSGVGRSISAGHRAAHCRRAQARCSLGGIAIRQPLGQCSGGQGTRRFAQPAGHRRCRAHLQGIPHLLGSRRWLRAYNAGASPQRLLWASTGAKDPKVSDTLYIQALAAPFTVNTMPEGTLKAFAEHGEINAIMAPDGGTSNPNWRNFPTLASTSTRLQLNCKMKAPSRSLNPGTNSWE